MPFQPIDEKKTPSRHTGDTALLTIRILVGLTFIYYQLADQIGLARLFLWEKAEWPLVESIASLGIPLPGVVAVASILLLLTAFLGLAVGIFTRVNALILFFLIGFAFLFPLEISKALTPQVFVLYLSIFLGFILGGGGRFALDGHFARKRAEAKQ